ncbi:hypothetical protein E5288_WYG019728 [Bos mutus]|uniref:Uncharacterized protein n=1 Tax=Bos mutus TaxID=72004 RepID=A0A6B0SF04_9CETA|nr:hypothetical protein [Bos mutus]
MAFDESRENAYGEFCLRAGRCRWSSETLSFAAIDAVLSAAKRTSQPESQPPPASGRLRDAVRFRDWMQNEKSLFSMDRLLCAATIRMH